MVGSSPRSCAGCHGGKSGDEVICLEGSAQQAGDVEVSVLWKCRKAENSSFTAIYEVVLVCCSIFLMFFFFFVSFNGCSCLWFFCFVIWCLFQCFGLRGAYLRCVFFCFGMGCYYLKSSANPNNFVVHCFESLKSLSLLVKVMAFTMMDRLHWSGIQGLLLHKPRWKICSLAFQMTRIVFM